MDLVASNTAMIPDGRSIPMYEIQEPLEEQLKGDVFGFVSFTIQILFKFVMKPFIILMAPLH